MIQDRHTVSVVIPTLGRETLTLCQTALAGQTRPPDEVIVVLDHERRGVAWGRNEGIRRSKGDLIAFTDDDTVAPADWLQEMISALDRHDAGAVGGTFLETDPFYDAMRRRRPSPLTEQIDTGGLVGNGGNIVFRRDVLVARLQQDGYVFNERFLTGEDWELIWRLRQHGVKMIYVAKPVTHLRRVSPLAHLRHSFNRGVGIAALYRAMRADPHRVVVQDSLLWGQRGKRSNPRWFRAAWEKLVGPFDMNHFPDKRLFWLFWLGEKFQSAGFLWNFGRESMRSTRASQRRTLS